MVPERVIALLDQVYITLLGTRDADHVPSAHRTWAMRFEDRERATVFIPDYSVAGLEANVADNGSISLVIGQPTTHECYQLKGEVETLGPCTERDRGEYEVYRAKLGAAWSPMYGAPAEVIGLAFGKPVLALTFKVREVFEQTPGPGAGNRISPKEGGR